MFKYENIVVDLPKRLNASGYELMNEIMRIAVSKFRNVPKYPPDKYPAVNSGALKNALLNNNVETKDNEIKKTIPLGYASVLLQDDFMHETTPRQRNWFLARAIDARRMGDRDLERLWARMHKSNFLHRRKLNYLDGLSDEASVKEFLKKVLLEYFNGTKAN